VDREIVSRTVDAPVTCDSVPLRFVADERLSALERLKEIDIMGGGKIIESKIWDVKIRGRRLLALRSARRGCVYSSGTTLTFGL